MYSTYLSSFENGNIHGLFHRFFLLHVISFFLGMIHVHHMKDTSFHIICIFTAFQPSENYLSVFLFVTIMYHSIFLFSSRNTVQNTQLLIVQYAETRFNAQILIDKPDDLLLYWICWAAIGRPFFVKGKSL